MIIDHLNTLGFDIDYTIIEKTDRVGGRILTHDFGSAKGKKWQYSDMGAMRLPQNHAPVFDMIDYINEKVKEENFKSHNTTHIT